MSPSQVYAADGLLLDQHNHLKLTGFDSAAPLDSAHSGNCTPRARTQFCKGCRKGCPGGWGRYDAASEQFAFGSILYNLATGLELHEELNPETNSLVRDLEFLPLGEALERMTKGCWVEESASLADLAQEAAEIAKHGTKFAYKYVDQGNGVVRGFWTRNLPILCLMRALLRSRETQADRPSGYGHSNNSSWGVKLTAKSSNKC